MLFKVTKSQTIFMLKQKETIFVFYLLLIMVLSNFFTNVFIFQGRDVIRMYQPMKLLLLSYNRVNYNGDATSLLIQLYPLLVVCPAGFSLAKEHQLGQDVFMTARLGEMTYKWSKLLAAFLVTSIVFSVPFLMEILLNCLSFPLAATGDLSNLSVYDSNYIQGVHNYLMSGLYLQSPYLYAIIGTFFWSAVSGVFAVFTVAFSAIVKVKYRITLFLPVFLFLNATVFFTNKPPNDTLTMKWYDYLLLFNDEPKSFIILCVGLLLLLLLSVVFIFLSSRREFS